MGRGVPPQNTPLGVPMCRLHLYPKTLFSIKVDYRYMKCMKIK